MIYFVSFFNAKFNVQMHQDMKTIKIPRMESAVTRSDTMSWCRAVFGWNRQELHNENSESFGKIEFVDISVFYWNPEMSQHWPVSKPLSYIKLHINSNPHRNWNKNTNKCKKTYEKKNRRNEIFSTSGSQIDIWNSRHSSDIQLLCSTRSDQCSNREVIFPPLISFNEKNLVKVWPERPM